MTNRAFQALTLSVERRIRDAANLTRAGARTEPLASLASDADVVASLALATGDVTRYLRFEEIADKLDGITALQIRRGR